MGKHEEPELNSPTTNGYIYLTMVLVGRPVTVEDIVQSNIPTNPTPERIESGLKALMERGYVLCIENLDNRTYSIFTGSEESKGFNEVMVKNMEHYMNRHPKTEDELSDSNHNWDDEVSNSFISQFEEMMKGMGLSDLEDPAEMREAAMGPVDMDGSRLNPENPLTWEEDKRAKFAFEWAVEMVEDHVNINADAFSVKRHMENCRLEVTKDGSDVSILIHEMSPFGTKLVNAWSLPTQFLLILNSEL